MLRPVAAAALLLMTASAASAQGPWDARWRFHHRNPHSLQLRIGGDYSLPQDSTVEGPVVLIGGNGQIDGHVEDDVVLLGGNVRIGPTAVVDGHVVRVGGNVTIDPAAQIRGEVSDAHITWPATRFGWPRFGDWWSRGVAFGATVLRLGLTLFGGLLLTLLAPGWLATIARRVSEMPGVSAVIGFATEMFLGPALVVIAIALVISIVGIPLLAGIPVLLAALAFVWVAGFTATAARVGASIRGNQSAWLEPRAGDFLLGFFVLTAVTIVGRLIALGPDWVAPFASAITRLGLFVEYCAWTLGLGAGLGAMFAGPRQVPPPIPPLPTPAS